MLLDIGPDGVEDTVRQLVTVAPGAAIVVLTSEEGLAAGLAAVNAGAQDYLVKGRSSAEAVGQAVRYAIVRKRTERTVAETTSQLTDVWTPRPMRCSPPRSTG